MRRALLLPALVALIVACDGGAPVEPARPAHVTSVDTPRGISMELVSMAPAARIVRLTRLR
jgi:nitrous oxide reductase accessory protein NosL